MQKTLWFSIYSVTVIFFVLIGGCKKYSGERTQYGKRALHAISEAKKLQIQSELTRISVALQQYSMDHGAPPDGDIEAVMQVLVPDYLQNAILKIYDFPIRYRRIGSGYQLAIWGEDGLWDTPDDIVVSGP